MFLILITHYHVLSLVTRLAQHLVNTLSSPLPPVCEPLMLLKGNCSMLTPNEVVNVKLFYDCIPHSSRMHPTVIEEKTKSFACQARAQRSLRT
jgi:hypothetical protein